MKKLYFSLFLFGSFCVLLTCSKNESVTDVLSAPNLPDEVFDYRNVDISNYPGLGISFGADLNNITNEGATLGRVLFYDTKLSVTNRISCASCHAQQAGFSDLKRFSKGFRNELTHRNSMAISNSVFMREFFWDLRIQNLDDMVLMPIQNHIEMGMEDLDILVAKLEHVDYYPALFEAAFGTSEINEENIASAIAQFLRYVPRRD